ncbi:hypothetical protein C8R46DRAFT_185255 [Mycena filopes]|nr:hypothetical protein C8R46DRAFT_185255 [Mycena filopes]
MLSKTFTAALLALMALPGSMGQIAIICNGGGTVGSCTQFITTFCTSISTKTIAGGDSASRCFAGPGTAQLRCDLTALNTLTVASHIDVNNCEAALSAAGNQCAFVRQIYRYCEWKTR